jgi:chaperonin GroEL
MALLYASKDLKSDSTGASIVKKACRNPFNQILVNAGYDNTQAEILSAQLVTANHSWNGYNIKTEEIVDMKEAGIIDPTKVARTALQNAASVAGTVLLTECTVVNEPSDDSKQQIDPMMGMM